MSEVLLEFATLMNVGLALCVAFYCSQVSWRLRGVVNVLASDVRWLCCSLVWILLMWPMRYICRKMELDEVADVLTLLSVPAISLVFLSILRFYNHIREP